MVKIQSGQALLHYKTTEDMQTVALCGNEKVVEWESAIYAIAPQKKEFKEDKWQRSEYMSLPGILT